MSFRSQDEGLVGTVTPTRAPTLSGPGGVRNQRTPPSTATTQRNEATNTDVTFSPRGEESPGVNRAANLTSQGIRTPPQELTSPPLIPKESDLSETDDSTLCDEDYDEDIDSFPSAADAAVSQEEIDLLENERDRLIGERVSMDSQLVSQWSRINTIIRETVATLEKVLPEEHIRVLTDQEHQLEALAEYVLDREGGMSPQRADGKRSSQQRHSGPSSQREKTSQRTISALDCVDLFHDETFLLVKSHVQNSIDSRLNRRHTQLQHVLETNEALLVQIEHLDNIRQRKLKEDMIRGERAGESIIAIYNTLTDFELRAQDRLEQEVEENFIVGGGGALKQLADDRSEIRFGPIFLANDVHQLRNDTHEKTHEMRYIQSVRDEERVEKWKLKLASTFFPNAFVEDIEQRILQINMQRQSLTEQTLPFEAYYNKIMEHENTNVHRKADRSVSPRSVSNSLMPTARGTSSSMFRDPSLGNDFQLPPDCPEEWEAASNRAGPYAGGGGRGVSPTMRSVSPASVACITAPAESSRSLASVSLDPNLFADRARSASTRSPSRREAAFRQNGMLHVSTSEAAVEHLLLPHQACSSVARTNGGEPLPSLKTLLARKAHLEKQLKRVQLQSKRELVVQLRMQEDAQTKRQKFEMQEKRKREVLDRASVTPSLGESTLAHRKN